MAGGTCPSTSRGVHGSDRTHCDPQPPQANSGRSACVPPVAVQAHNVRQGEIVSST